MERESFVVRPHRDEWETPAFEEIALSAEATAYMGVWEDPS
jgi:coenzyme PQQ precursor peptide PqqA